MTQSSSESNSSAPLGAQQESLQQLDLLQGFPALRDALIPAAPEPVNVAAGRVPLVVTRPEVIGVICMPSRIEPSQKAFQLN